jgi:hypothetical protein
MTIECHTNNQHRSWALRAYSKIKTALTSAVPDEGWLVHAVSLARHEPADRLWQ